MKRDEQTFPADPTGDALWEMQQNGDDLTKQREIEFTVVFSTEEEALEFGNTLLVNRQKILLSDNEEEKEFPFEIIVYVYMEANYDEICGYEELLESHATKFNGQSDGWGCLEQN
jgi:Regulator of ribonuclease activity B